MTNIWSNLALWKKSCTFYVQQGDLWNISLYIEMFHISPCCPMVCNFFISGLIEFKHIPSAPWGTSVSWPKFGPICTCGKKVTHFSAPRWLMERRLLNFAQKCAIPQHVNCKNLVDSKNIFFGNSHRPKEVILSIWAKLMIKKNFRDFWKSKKFSRIFFFSDSTQIWSKHYSGVKDMSLSSIVCTSGCHSAPIRLRWLKKNMWHRVTHRYIMLGWQPVLTENFFSSHFQWHRIADWN